MDTDPEVDVGETSERMCDLDDAVEGFNIAGLVVKDVDAGFCQRAVSRRRTGSTDCTVVLDEVTRFATLSTEYAVRGESDALVVACLVMWVVL